MCENCNCGSDDTQQSFEEKVKDVLEAVRPNLQSHGGDVEFVSVEDDKSVNVRLKGACSGCPSAQMTLKMGIEQMLKEQIPEVSQVVAVD
jgi:Fe-S cluster biogenesis protein NfuA